MDEAISRLGDSATPEQRAEVAKLAGALYDLQAAEKSAETAGRELQKTQQEGRQVFEATRTASEKYAAEIEKWNALLAAGTIDQETYARVAANAVDALRQAQTDPLSGAIRALDDYAESAADMAKGMENAIASAFSGAEDAVGQSVETGKARRLGPGHLDHRRPGPAGTAPVHPRAALQCALPGADQRLRVNLLAGFRFGDDGRGQPSWRRVAGADGTPVDVPVALFARAPRFHEGSPVLHPDEVPAVLQTGERVLSRREVAERERAAAPVVFNVYAQDARSFMGSRTQIAAGLSRMVEAGRRGR